MKETLSILSFLFLFAISGCNFATPSENDTIQPELSTELSPVENNDGEQSVIQDTNELMQGSTPNRTLTPELEIKPTITPTTDLLGNIYDCEMSIEFTSGPLESQSTNFTVLGEDYFTDKDDKFGLGKGTGIYYEPQQYFILHSSYIRQLVDRPLEAEFLRKYLERWGQAGPQTIQANIDSLISSEAIWTCAGGSRYTTKVNGIVRLSHDASMRLWLEPLNIPEILTAREGLATEWVGEIKIHDNSRFLLGFCGWGPESLGDERYTYFRYLVSFDVLNISG